MTSGRLTKDLAQRIEERSTTEWSDDACWFSDRASVRGGYIPLTRMVDGERINRMQHVIAWEMHNAEPVPDGMVVMHTCDNPGCFNPNHLRLGTQSDNIRDCIAKGRHNSISLTGDRGGSATRYMVKFLKSLGFRKTKVADILGINKTHVSRHLK